MAYQPLNFDHLLGTTGFSDTLLKNHFTLYQGYVTNTNKLIDNLMLMTKENKMNTPEFAELKRRMGWEFNGMRLHEYYFANMSKTSQSLDPASSFAKLVNDQFGSLDSWTANFKASGAMRGIGWVISYYDPVIKRVFNAWINEHDVGHLSGTIPLLVMDVFEHAYITDYGIKRADYIEAFFRQINWDLITQRFDSASQLKLMF